ncbi:MAG: hypothetical protein Sv326_0261 [Candidatus Fermentimicrarchaeum limneticum]|uniref:Uncharacterized protein n=1 Tax=Fermentimicrarchaeum limneticum TaxID=2795018 RepID=A0A7D6BL27_FERL1|nr:MAG: hypothetical protein Sv326_0261 [Candidatus Fermentimicrarchaeum limneticum]
MFRVNPQQGSLIALRLISDNCDTYYALRSACLLQIYF